MYMKALECVVLGDSNVKCFDVFMAVMKEVYATLLPLSIDKDGMGLADKEKQQQIVAETQHESMEANVVLHKDTGDGESSCSGVGVNEKKRQRGRPTTSRDKAPYEQQLKASQFCTICREQGHKCTTRPQPGDLPKAPRKSPKCTNCGVVGHRRYTSGTKKTGAFEPNFL